MCRKETQDTCYNSWSTYRSTVMFLLVKHVNNTKHWFPDRVR